MHPFILRFSHTLNNVLHLPITNSLTHSVILLFTHSLPHFLTHACIKKKKNRERNKQRGEKGRNAHAKIKKEKIERTRDDEGPNFNVHLFTRIVDVLTCPDAPELQFCGARRFRDGVLKFYIVEQTMRRINHALLRIYVELQNHLTKHIYSCFCDVCKKGFNKLERSPAIHRLCAELVSQYSSS